MYGLVFLFKHQGKKENRPGVTYSDNPAVFFANQVRIRCSNLIGSENRRAILIVPFLVVLGGVCMHLYACVCACMCARATRMCVWACVCVCAFLRS